jgi:hypothetical protein
MGTYGLYFGVVEDSISARWRPSHRFVVEYLGGGIVAFELVDDGRGGTDLALTDSGVAEQWYAETLAGWVSVLLALKAAVEFGVDLRNHDPARSWDQGYCARFKLQGGHTAGG